jgi:hypothetical protein
VYSGYLGDKEKSPELPNAPCVAENRSSHQLFLFYKTIGARFSFLSATKLFIDHGHGEPTRLLHLGLGKFPSSQQLAIGVSLGGQFKDKKITKVFIGAGPVATHTSVPMAGPATPVPVQERTTPEDGLSDSEF